MVTNDNRSRSISQYSSTAPRLSGQNCKFFKFLLSLNSQKRLGYKETNAKNRNRVVVVRSEHSEIMVDTDYFFDVSFKTFRLVLEPSSVEI